uniref:Aminopeptidase N n=1 Tax=Anthurium amnicola TaxID=1678845 RepID=A0A1D1ZFG5_9ARAE
MDRRPSSPTSPPAPFESGRIWSSAGGAPWRQPSASSGPRSAPWAALVAAASSCPCSTSSSASTPSMIMGASASSVWYNIRVAHPTKEVPIIDYNLALLFQPMLMLGITIGVALSVVFPYWLITVLIIILFVGTSSRSFFKGILMWKEETLLKKEIEKRQQQARRAKCGEEVLLDADYTPLPSEQERSSLDILRSNISWKGILVLLTVWFSFLVLQILKTNVAVCSPTYWVINILQLPVAISVFAWEACKLYRESKERRMAGNWECVCEASIEWSVLQLLFCALCGILGGTVGGLLGSGGGFILGPLLLEIGVIPQVASATATFVMLFSSSLSVVEFYFLKRFPIPYALYLMSVSLMAGFWGQFLVRKLVVLLKRASIIVFILSSVIFASALTMGVVGIEKSIHMINNHEYMGFLSFCTE